MNVEFFVTRVWVLMPCQFSRKTAFNLTSSWSKEWSSSLSDSSGRCARRSLAWRLCFFRGTGVSFSSFLFCEWNFLTCAARFSWAMKFAGQWGHWNDSGDADDVGFSWMRRICLCRMSERWNLWEQWVHSWKVLVGACDFICLSKFRFCWYCFGQCVHLNMLFATRLLRWYLAQCK